MEACIEDVVEALLLGHHSWETCWDVGLEMFIICWFWGSEVYVGLLEGMDERCELC